MSQEKGITLFALQERIKERINSSFPHQYWVMCEVSSIKANVTGHCYLDLIDKDENAQSLTAKAQAIIWSSSWKILRPYFESATGTPLAVGMNILVKAQVQYSELYGLSLIIYDIEPSYTVGEMEMARVKIIARLKQEGMFDMNSSLPFPKLPRKLAIISSETAAGYRDFMKHLHENEYGFQFLTTLFSAPMQGNLAPEGIIAALDEVAGGDFDAVLLIRGGGSAVDLSCFDDYTLSAHIAQFPIPVMTAIGHDQDYHICDMVAGVSVKTPTALADYIVGLFASEDAYISSLSSQIFVAMTGKIAQERAHIEQLADRLLFGLKTGFSSQLNRILMLEQKIAMRDPASLIKSGVVFVQKEGIRISSVDNLLVGDKIETLMKDGILECTIDKINKNGKK